MSVRLIFDIETIPDARGLRLLLGLPSSTSDTDVINVALYQRRQNQGTEFLPLHQHQICAISCAMRDDKQFRVWSLGDEQSDEKELIQRFFDGIERLTPTLVSWNGGGFDLPVLHYRSLIHNLSATRYWDWGDNDKDFKWNNYLNRYHTRHLDLMDVLAMYQARANAPLHEIAQLCGFPGKLGMEGSQVWQAYQQGRLADIRHYCEVDVVNTYLIDLRFQHLRGQLTAADYTDEIMLVRNTLSQSTQAHWHEFLAKWPLTS